MDQPSGFIGSGSEEATASALQEVTAINGEAAMAARRIDEIHATSGQRRATGLAFLLS